MTVKQPKPNLVRWFFFALFFVQAGVFLAMKALYGSASSQTVRWYFAIFFVLLGAYFLINEFYGPEGSFHAVDPETLQRLDDAFDRRHEPDKPSRMRAVRFAGACFLLAVLAAFTHVEFIVLYGIMCLLAAVFSAIAYFQLRNVADKRIAVLTPRRATAVIPGYWFAAFAIAGLSILAFAWTPAFTVSSIVVCISTLITTIAGFRVTQLGAILSGVDLPAEQAVDNRMRFMRSSSTLVLASAQPAAFCWQAMGPFEYNSPQFAVFVFTIAVFIGYNVWFWRKRSIALRINAAPPAGASASLSQGA